MANPPRRLRQVEDGFQTARRGLVKKEPLHGPCSCMRQTQPGRPPFQPLRRIYQAERSEYATARYIEIR
jgi:hypothetical protein